MSKANIIKKKLIFLTIIIKDIYIYIQMILIIHVVWIGMKF